MNDNTCIRCGRVIPEGRCVCLHCGSYDDMQTFKPRKSVTNGDKIRGMTDEQLIPVVLSYACALHTAGCPTERCDNCVRKWLKSEVKGA